MIVSPRWETRRRSLADLAVLQRVRFVMRGGRVVVGQTAGDRETLVVPDFGASR